MIVPFCFSTDCINYIIHIIAQWSHQHRHFYENPLVMFMMVFVCALLHLCSIICWLRYYCMLWKWNKMFTAQLIFHLVIYVSCFVLFFQQCLRSMIYFLWQISKILVYSACNDSLGKNFNPKLQKIFSSTTPFLILRERVAEYVIIHHLQNLGPILLWSNQKMYKFVEFPMLHVK